MKHVFSVILLTTLFFCGCQTDSFHIKGDLHQTNASKAYLIHVNPVNNSVEVLDSSEVHEGHFSFKGSVSHPIACTVKIGRKTKINLLVENSIISITGSVQIPEEIKIKGSRSDDDFHYLINTSQSIAAKKNEIWADMVENKSLKKNSEFNSQLMSIEDSMLVATKCFVEKHPASVGAAYFLYYLYLDRQIEIDQLAPIIGLLDHSIAQSEYVKYLQDEIRLSCKLEKDSKAPDFSINSVHSDSVYMLHDFRGKYLYLDFSATWMKNWEKRMKSLSKLKTDLDSVPFDILTVYLDINKAGLENHLSNMKVGWKQACSFDYWECEVTKHYGVDNIPYGFLIDPKGTILAVNPNIKELDSLIKK